MTGATRVRWMSVVKATTIIAGIVVVSGVEGYAMLKQEVLQPLIFVGEPCFIL